MSIVGLGIDLTPIDRIGAAWNRHGARLLEKLFIDGEIRRTPHPLPAFLDHVAGRFAAKEAAMKALGTGWGNGVGWKSIRIDRLPSGEPTLILSGAAERIARLRGVDRIHLTITHGGGVAVAVVILENGSRQLPLSESG